MKYKKKKRGVFVGRGELGVLISLAVRHQWRKLSDCGGMAGREGGGGEIALQSLSFG